MVISLFLCIYKKYHVIMVISLFLCIYKNFYIQKLLCNYGYKSISLYI